VGTIQKPRQLPIYDSAQLANPLLDDLSALVKYRDLLVRLVLRNITTRYKRSLLGVAWTMINPLMTMLVMALVFSSLFTGRVSYYPIYVLSGLVAWGFFAQTTGSIMTELIWGGSLLQRVYVPRTIFAFSALGTGLVNFALSLVPLLLLLLVFGAPLTPMLAFVPVAMLLLSMFTLGLGLVLSTLAVQFGDVVEMYQIVLVAWMYLTPIIYPITIIPEEFRSLFLLNPMYYMIEIFRAPIWQGQLPDPETTLIAAALALTTLLGGLWFFVRKADEIAYRI
jgi:ABC-type polysaccharide/polyol phosphate export permease